MQFYVFDSLIEVIILCNEGLQLLKGLKDVPLCVKLWRVTSMNVVTLRNLSRKLESL